MFILKGLEVEVALRLKRVSDKTVEVTFLEQRKRLAGVGGSKLCKWLKSRPFPEAWQCL